VIDRWNPVFVYFVSIVAATAGLLFGFDIAVINGALIFLREQFHLTEVGTETAASALLVGCVAGASIAGWFSDPRPNTGNDNQTSFDEAGVPAFLRDSGTAGLQPGAPFADRHTGPRAGERTRPRRASAGHVGLSRGATAGDGAAKPNGALVL
jgi:MFS family permease